jgi:hypothetical protein
VLEEMLEQCILITVNMIAIRAEVIIKEEDTHKEEATGVVIGRLKMSKEIDQ